MDNKQYYTEEFKQRFLLGDLTPKEDYAFRKLLREDHALREEIELLKAMQHVETEGFIAARFSEEDTAEEEKSLQGSTISFYRKGWYRVAASIVVLLGLGWLLWIGFGPEKTVLTTQIPVRQSTDGSLGWAGTETGNVFAVISMDEQSPLSYTFFDDTLKVFTPASIKDLTGNDKLYLLDDLRSRRLLLVIDGKKYEVEPGIEEVVPLIETE